MGLAKKIDIVYVYGTKTHRYFKPLNSNIIIRPFPNNKRSLIITFIYLIIRLIIKYPFLSYGKIKNLYINSNNWNIFIKKTCKILIPLFDNLDILHIQWAKTLKLTPEIIEMLKCPIVLSLRGAHINYSPLSDSLLSISYKTYFPKII